MGVGRVILGILSVIAVVLLLVYFFLPVGVVEFNPANLSQRDSNTNFSLGPEDNSSLQFYPNMRYKSSDISYRISNECPLNKQNDMQEAFNMISERTVLNFYPVVYGEEISVTCSSDNIFTGDAFVGGEGGVTNVTIVSDYHVIFKGKILLIRNSPCAEPKIAIHELLHALGFDHSSNPDSIMYDTTSCDQNLGDQIPSLINELYTVPEYPDLTFDGIDAHMTGRYLSANVSVRNNGFSAAPDSKIVVSVDDKIIKEFELNALDIGYGRKISFTNLRVNQINFEEIEFSIESNFSELDKSNNLYVLSVKN